MALLASGLCGTGAILYLSLRLWAQGRVREAGILFSVGVNQREFLGQMLAECLAVSAAALALAFLLSGPVINQCADAAERLAAPKAGRKSTRWRLTKGSGPSLRRRCRTKRPKDILSKMS